MDNCVKDQVLSWDKLLLVMRITGGVTAVLSVLGASLIIITYAAYKNLRTTARQLLVNLSIADIIVSGSHFVGILQDYEHDLLIQSGPVNHTHRNESRLPELLPPYYYTTNALCDTQAAFTALGTVASFLWSMLIAVYMLALTQSTSAKPRKVLVPIIYIVSWGIPVVIVIGLAALSYLGYNRNDSPGKIFQKCCL
jgi:G protein-coupled receptor 157